jgi:formylglycine-generating enzyme required for sulfatase activity
MAENGHLMIRVPGAVEFLQGSPSMESGRDAFKESLHQRRIPRSFAISAHETTVEQFLAFQPNFNYSIEYSSDPKCPVNSVSWFDAARYCRWLSEQEGVLEEQMCYPPIEEIQPGMSLPENMLERTGYRLPTESEWEFAARARTPTSRSYGSAESLLDHYAWTVRNSDYHSQPVGRLLPNRLGLFDTLGNVMEWCNDPWRDYPILQSQQFLDELHDRELTEARRATRGGAFLYEPLTARCAQRNHHIADHRRPYLGFRVARTVKSPGSARRQQIKLD